MIRGQQATRTTLTRHGARRGRVALGSALLLGGTTPASYRPFRGDALRVKVGPREVVQLVPVGTIPGVALLAAAGRNGPGTGSLRSQGDGTKLSWRAPGSATWGADVPTSGDGVALLEDGEDLDKWVRVRVASAFLASTPAEAQVLLADLFNAVGHDDVSAAAASSGAVETYRLDLQNDGPMDLQDLRAWVDASTLGIELSLDGAAWSTPTTEGTGLSFGALAAGDARQLHLRRTVGAAAASDPDVLTVLQFAWDGY